MEKKRKKKRKKRKSKDLTPRHRHRVPAAAIEGGQKRGRSAPAPGAQTGARAAGTG